MTLPATARTAPLASSDASLYARLELYGRLYGADARFSGEMGDGWKLAASLENVSVSEVLADLCDGDTLPLFDGTRVSIGAVLHSAEKRFALHADVRDLPPVRFEPGATFKIDHFTLDAALQAGRLESLALSASGTLTVGDGARVVFSATTFTYHAGARTWSVGAGVTLHVLEGEHALALEYSSSPDGRHLRAEYAATPAVRLLDLGFARLLMERLSFSLDQPAAGGGTRWTFEASACVEVDEVARLCGTLRVSDHAVEVVNLTPLRLPFTIGERTVTFEAALARLGAQWKERAGWSLYAETTLALQGLPDGLRQVFPKPLEIGVSLGRGGDGRSRLEISLRTLLQLAFVPSDIVVTDPATGKEYRIELSRFGQVGVAVTRFGVKVDSTGIAVGVETGLGLPYMLNAIFGTDDAGRPTHVVLRTLPPPPQEPGADDYCTAEWKLQRPRGGAGAGTSFTFQPTNSLFPEHLAITGGRWNLDLGQAGRVWMEVPTLAFNVETGAFECRVKAGRDGKLAIPLELLRSVLHRTFPGREADIDRVVPASIPISEIRAFRDGRLQVEPLLEYVGGFVHDAEVLAELRKVAEKVAGTADALPDALKPYLAFVVPEEFEATLSLRPATSDVRVGLRVKGAREEDDEGIRVLMPVPSGVCLYGVNFRGFSFGPMLAGRVFRLELDADVDAFNLPLIAAGMLVPPDGPLVPARRQHDHTEIRNLVTLIVIVQAGPVPVPVPVPVFYDRLAWTHHDLFDFQAGLAAEFYPRPDLVGTLKLLYRLYTFVKDPDAELKTEDLTDDMRLFFRLGKPAFLQLPGYLGKDLSLGTRDGYLIQVAPLDLLARVLNTLKRTRINDVVRLVDLPRRTFVIGGPTPEGEAVPPLSLWGLTLKGAAVLATPHEFIAGAYRAVGYADEAQARDALRLSPAKVDENAQGMVLMATGQVEGELGRVYGEYALASVEGRSFMTGVRFRGQVAPPGSPSDGLDLALTARLVASPDQRELYAQAEAYLRLLGMELFTACVRVEAQREVLKLSGTLSLFPATAPVSVAAATDATISTTAGVDIDARLESVVLGFIPGASGSFRLQRGQMRLSTRWWGFGIDYQVRAEQDALTTELTAAIPVISLQSRWRYTVSTRSLRGWLYGSLPGGTGFEAWLDVAQGPRADGRCSVTVLGIQVVDAAIWLHGGSAYGVSGTYNVFPPNPVLNFALSGSGGLDAGGLALSFQGSTGFLDLVTLQAGAWVNANGAGTALRASVGWSSTDVASGLFRFPSPNGPVSFLMQWKVGWLPTTYAAVGPGGIGWWLWNPPGGWPMGGAAVEDAADPPGQPEEWTTRDFWTLVDHPMLPPFPAPVADGDGDEDEREHAAVRRYRMLGDLGAHGAHTAPGGAQVGRVHVHRPSGPHAADPFAELVHAAEAEIRRRTRTRPLLRRAAIARARTLHEMVVEHTAPEGGAFASVLELVGADYALRVPQERTPGPAADGAALARFLVDDTPGGPAWLPWAVAAAAAAAAAWLLLG